jgi:hypothetical protein
MVTEEEENRDQGSEKRWERSAYKSLAISLGNAGSGYRIRKIAGRLNRTVVREAGRSETQRGRSKEIGKCWDCYCNGF